MGILLSSWSASLCDAGIGEPSFAFPRFHFGFKVKLFTLFPSTLWPGTTVSRLILTTSRAYNLDMTDCVTTYTTSSEYIIYDF